MKITRFTIPADDALKVGLNEIRMDRLGSIIAIAGKNGAGKSRILSELEHTILAWNKIQDKIYAYRENVASYAMMIQQNPGSTQTEQWRRLKEKNQKSIDYFDRISTDSGSAVKPIQFVPRGMSLPNPLADSPSITLRKFQSAASSPIQEFEHLCLSYIQQSQNRWWNATHPGFSESTETKDKIVQDYESLQSLVESFLGVRVTRSPDGAALIFGHSLADAKLSNGQKVLIQLATAVHAKKANLNDAIFILDELENHLHPSVAIDILEKIREVAPQAQIWLATHSIPLLAHVMATEPASLWYVDGGSVAHAGRKPELVLTSLIGDENRIGELHAFTSLPAQLAAINYAAESLLPPGVVASTQNDPQVEQIQRSIWRPPGEARISLLDFGAGKGRLLEGLQSLSTRPISEVVDYVAFDEYANDSEYCKLRISSLLGSADNRYFNDQDELTSARGSASFDIAVMCNVLHEIPPQRWLELFSSGSILTTALKVDAYLLIVEDLRIPTGEKAHEHGFLVFDTTHLRTLFAVSQSDITEGLFKFDDARGDGRLKAHMIRASLFQRVSSSTRSAAISQLRDTALRRIRELRQQPHSYSAGILHGFWTQQYANAALALQDLGPA